MEYTAIVISSARARVCPKVSQFSRWLLETAGGPDKVQVRGRVLLNSIRTALSATRVSVPRELGD
jgi:hypothetical protein